MIIALLICNKKLSIEHKYPLVSYSMFLQMLKMLAQSIASTSSPQRNTHIRASRVFKFNLIAQVAFDCILFGKPTLTNSCTWWNENNFLPKLHKFRPMCVPSQFATTYAPHLKYHFVLTLMSKCFYNFLKLSLTHVTFFFNVLKLQQYPFEPQFDTCDLITIIAWINTRVECQLEHCIESIKTSYCVLDSIERDLCPMQDLKIQIIMS